jgi:hypothetical protein
MSPLLTLLLGKGPELIRLIKQWWADTHPGEPVPTDAEVKAAWAQAAVLSLTKDDDWLGTHPAADIRGGDD